jgi:phosphoesterase RecJ-like protein
MLDLWKECEGAARIGIAGHVRPDGDCVGACLALYQYVRKCFPEAVCQVLLETPSEIFADILGYDEIVSDFKPDTMFDVLFILDCEFDRLGGAEKYYHSAVKTVNIDHHVSNKAETCTVNHVIPDIGSCCEVIFDLMEEERLDRDIALALYVGMIHDTGVFQYSNTTPKTMEKAAKLMRFGFDFSKVIEESFYQKTYRQSLILGRTLMESVRFMNGRCIVGWVDQKVKNFYGVGSKEMDGIVNQLRNIKGIDCAIFMHQTGNQEYKVSLRSNEKLDVSKVALYFGGGGHVRAAGCSMTGTVHDCINNLSREIAKHIHKGDD